MQILFRYLLWICATVTIVPLVGGVPKQRMCIEYSDESSQQVDDDMYDSPSSEFQDTAVAIPTISTLTPKKVQCQADFNFCFGLWSSDANETKTVKQGCWKESGDRNVTCLQKSCFSFAPTGTTGSMKLYYCCCSGDLCNQNMTALSNFELTASKPIISVSIDAEDDTLLWLSPIFLLALTLGVVFIVAIAITVICRTTEFPSPEASPLAPSGPGYSSNLQNVDNLKLCAMIGRGKYGTVWKGMVNEQAVAVKIFPEQHKQYFINERNIYSLPLMESPSLLIYFGCDERRILDNQIEYFLVLSLAPLGCLQDWLIDNAMSFGTFCKMTKSITRGLSHLHTELQKGDDTKPCVAHRDLNTRNILVNADLSCCIADFGFALKLFGAKYEYKGEVALAETKSINEVGTLRYMAPEILEGAVNLRDCETALKQMDVYSLGLVLWEVSMRCADFYPQGQVTPAYKAPYELEVGQHPTFEQMQVLVARHKARPLFAAGWGGGPAGKLVKDTCEDCWDHDAEARLTSLCAEERMQELVNLKARMHISQGSSPLLNAANNLGGTLPGTRLRSFSSASCNSDNLGTSVTAPPNQKIIPRVRSCGNDASVTIVNLAMLPDTEFQSQPHTHTEKNHLMQPQQQIQPYQGRNPCQERNLAPIHNRTAQVLVERSKKHSFQDKGQENSFSCLEDDVSVEDLISTNSKKFTKDGPSMGQGFPKQNNTDKKLRGWHGVRALIQKKLFRRDSSSSSEFIQQAFDEKSNLVDNRLVAPTKANCSPTKDTTDSPSMFDEKNSNYLKGKEIIQTTLDSQASGRRPNNLHLEPMIVRVGKVSPENKSNLIKNISEEFNCNVDHSEGGSYIDTRISTPTRLVTRSLSTHVMKNLNNNNVTTDVFGLKTPVATPTIITAVAAERQFRRQRSLEVFREVFSGRGSTDKLRDPSQRVKTPGDVPPSVRKVRASKTLSLYDDRMMDSSTLNIL